MAFDFSTLVTDRKQSDVAYVKQLIAKIVAGTETEAELAEWKSFTLKGSYNYTDLNRVTAAMEDLKLRLEGYGYSVPGYQRIEIEHPIIPKKLPDGYIELEYIESTGTQYIDTGFKPNQDTKVVMDAQLTSVASHQAFFSARSDDNTDTLELMWHYSGGCYRFHYDDGYRNTATFDGLVRRVLVVDKNVATVDGTDFSRTYSTYQSPNVLWLLARKQGGSPYILAKAKLYSCQIYDNGTLVRNFVPCINPNGEVGLYDTATKSFFGNSGTGAFISGARVGIVLPEEYTRVEYIESTGTQYINTGISVPHASCKIAVKFKTRNILDRPPITGYAYTAWSWSANMMFPYQDVFYANGSSTGIAFAANTLYNAEYTNAYVTVNGKTVQKSIANTVDGYNNTIFYGSTRYGAHLLYEYRLYNGETLVRDMIPVVRKQDEEAGLYDLVNGVFYGNAGTGEFIAGGYLPKDYKRVEYIESTGDAYINTQYVASSGTTIEVDASTEYSAIEFGARIGAMNNAFLLGIRGQDKCARFHFANNGYAEFSIADPQNKHTYMISGDGKCYFDGVLKTTQTGSFSNNLHTYLFCINNGGSKGTGAGKMYRAKITNSGVVVRDYVPVVRVSDEASGMYDLENGVFYQNAGTGTFKTGGIIQEPSLSPPIDTDPYTWYEFDWPTPEAMTLYLLNVAAIRTVLSVLQSTPRVPPDMEKLMVKEANDIEQIVLDVYRQITIMSTTFIACGEALCGGDNL